MHCQKKKIKMIVSSSQYCIIVEAAKIRILLQLLQTRSIEETFYYLNFSDSYILFYTDDSIITLTLGICRLFAMGLYYSNCFHLWSCFLSLRAVSVIFICCWNCKGQFSALTWYCGSRQKKTLVFIATMNYDQFKKWLF